MQMHGNRFAVRSSSLCMFECARVLFCVRVCVRVRLCVCACVVCGVCVSKNQGPLSRSLSDGYSALKQI